MYLGMLAIIAGALAIFIPGMAGLVTVSSLIGGAFVYFIGAGVFVPGGDNRGDSAISASCGYSRGGTGRIAKPWCWPGDIGSLNDAC